MVRTNLWDLLFNWSFWWTSFLSKLIGFMLTFVTCTIALHIHAMATKIFSFRFNLHPIPTKVVTKILTTTPVTNIPRLIDTTFPLISLSFILAPAMPKRTGWQIIQKISKAVAAGLSSISQPCLDQQDRATKAALTQPRGPAPPYPMISLVNTATIPPESNRRIRRGVMKGSFLSGT